MGGKKPPIFVSILYYKAFFKALVNGSLFHIQAYDSSII